MEKEKIDIFISSKSEDYGFADKVYNYLTYNGYNVFYASRVLDQLGESEYSKAIDDALDKTTHMIVVATSVDNIKSHWVEHEWGTFCNDLKSDYRVGEIITIISRDIQREKLPASLRHRQAFYLDDYEQKILGYFKKDSDKSSEQVVEPSDDSQDNSLISILGWHESQDDSPSIEDIPLFNKTTPLLPTVFSRFWLHEFAFESLADPENTIRNNGFLSILVSDCLDLLEFLFLYADHPDLKVHPISISDTLNHGLFEINNHTSSDLSKQLLNEKEIWNIWGDSPDDYMYIILFKGHVIGGTSPLTLLFTSPQCRSFFQSQNDSFYGEIGQVLFKDTTPFSERGEHFKEYVTGIVAIINDNKNSFSRYVISQFDDQLKQFFYYLTAIPQGELANQQYATYEPIICDQEGTQGSIPTIHHLDSVVLTDKKNIHILLRKIKAEQLISTKFCIQPSSQEASHNNHMPLVLSEFGTDNLHFLKSRKPKNKIQIPTSISQIPLDRRILPETHLEYPYLVAEDFIEDKLISLDFETNFEKFFLIGDKKNHFLLPIKPLYFRYFSVEDLKQQLHYEINNKSNQIHITLRIPVVGNNDFDTIDLLKSFKEEDIIHLVDSTRLSIWPDYKLPPQEENLYSVTVSNPKSGIIDKACFGRNDYLFSADWHQYDDLQFCEIGTFDFIQLEIKATAGLLIPQFNFISQITGYLSIGIDLGHAYTKITYSINREAIKLNVRKLHVMNLNSAHDMISGWKTELTEMRMIIDGNDFVPLPPYLPANDRTYLFIDLFSDDSFSCNKVRATEAYCEQMVQILHNQVVHESSLNWIGSYHVNIAIPSCCSAKKNVQIRDSWNKAFQRFKGHVEFECVVDMTTLLIRIHSSDYIIIDIGKHYTSAALFQLFQHNYVCSYPIGTRTIWDDAFRNSVSQHYLYDLWAEYYRNKANNESIIHEMNSRKDINWMDYLYLEASQQALEIQTRLFDDFPDLRALVFTFFAAVIWKIIKNIECIQAPIPNCIYLYGQGIKPLLYFMTDYDITTAINRLICSFSHQDETAFHTIVEYHNPISEIATCASLLDKTNKIDAQAFFDKERIRTIEDIDHNELLDEFILFIHSLRDMKHSDLPFDLHHVCELFEKYASRGIHLSMHRHALSTTSLLPDATFFWPLEGSFPDIIREILLSTK